MKKRMLSMLLVVVLVIQMLPISTLAIGSNQAFKPTAVYVTPTENEADDDSYVTIQWKTENRVNDVTNDNNIKASYIEFVFQGGTGTISDGGNTSAGWDNTSITPDGDGNQVLKLYFSPDLLERTGQYTTARYTLRMTPGTVLVRVGEKHEHDKNFGGKVSFYGGKTVSDGTFIDDGYIGNIKGYYSNVEISSHPQYKNLLWSNKPYIETMKTMNKMKLAADSVKISASNSSLPKGQTVTIPITVSALTELGSDAAHAYTGAANSSYLIDEDVYAKVTDIKYTGADYGNGVSFSENKGKLYMHINESIYDKIGNSASIELPLVATVTQTLTGDTVTGSKTITLERPTVTRNITTRNISAEWLYNTGYYKATQKAKLTAKSGYLLPDSIAVTVGSTLLEVDTGYTYDKTTGIVKIFSSSVTGTITIEAIAEKMAVPLDNINNALPNFNPEAWYNESGSTLNTAQGWSVSTEKNGTYSDSVKLDGEGKEVTKTLYFKDSGGNLYSYELKYNRDVTAPTISGLENGKVYCGPQTFTVTEENLRNVTINGTAVSADSDSKFTVSPAVDAQTVVATDNAGNYVTYSVTVNDGHTLSYAADENVLKETCAYCSHNTTATITATDAIYAGSPLETASVAYSDGWLGGNPEIAYQNNNGAGEATASITKGEATASVKFTISAGSQQPPANIGATNETIDGKADGKITGVDDSMEYRKDGESNYAAITGTMLENLAAGTYYVRYKANANYNASSDSGPIVINSGRKLVVTFEAGEATVTTKEVSWNGKIDSLPDIPSKVGYDQTAPTWDKSLEDLKNIQEDVTVTAQYTLNNYGVTLPDNQVGYSLSADKASVEHGGEITLTLALKPGYSATDDFSVSASGNSVTMTESGGVYTGTVTGVSEAQNITVSGVEDITAPDNLVVSYGTDNFKEFLNTITFGLFFNDTVTVTLSANDIGSGVKEFTYRAGDGNKQTATATSGSATFTVTPEFKGNISEVTAVDNAGNATAEQAYQFFAAEKAAPNAPSVDTGAYASGSWSDKSVTFTVSGSSSTGGIQKYQYSDDNGQSWQDLEATEKTEAASDTPANVTEAKLTVAGDVNGTKYIFRAVSNAGNEGAESEAVTLKIDTALPTISVSANTDAIKTADTVSITATAGISGAGVTVSKDGGTPERIFGDTYQVIENGTYTFLVTNGAGVTDEASITYQKIDTKTPAISLDSGDYEDGSWANKAVTLTVENSTANLGNDAIEYKVGGSLWQLYTEPISVSEDTDKDGTTYTFRITAENGLKSAEESITVKKDSIAPEVSGVTNNGTYYTTQKASVTDANLDTVTLNDTGAPNQLTLAGNKNVSYEILAVDKAGNGTRVVVNMKPITSLADSISSLTGENVKSSDQELAEQVKAALQGVDVTNANEEEKTQLSRLIENCDDLLQSISDVAAKIKELTDAVNGYAADSVKSSDKTAIQDLIENMDALISGDNLTDDEKSALGTVAEQGDLLLDKIEEAAEASKSDALAAVEDVTADNVSLEDKGSLEQALKDLTEALEKFDDRYTEAEKAAMQDKLDDIKGSLEVIERVEAVKELIDRLSAPESIKLSDEAAINAAKAAYDALSDYEKSLVDTGKLDNAVKALNILSGAASSPKTGDPAQVSLWLALMLSAAFGAAGWSVYRKRTSEK